ncbi:MAG: polyprenyl synthetase family protein [Flavobacteriales bacterium]|nr:polyprenyl synthetase family protein [Flavobacteriales bacterium]
MADKLTEIKSPIAEELKEFEKRFRNSMKSNVPLLDTIMNYIVKRKGKQMRPLFVLLSTRLFGVIGDRAYRGAALVELLHTATLVHDDVVDDSSMRRGFFSVNALWKNKVAVLVGDYLLSKGLLLALKNGDYPALTILSEAVEQMSEGELLQMEKARKLDITEEVYFDIISKKTASLIASCCSIGAWAGGADNDAIQEMRQFGLYTGIAFQIKDDLFDYGDNPTGKPKGIDIKEKKMTLPLIHALNKADERERKQIIRLIRKGSKRSDDIDTVIRFVEKHDGISYARKHLAEYQQKALRTLDAMGLSSAREIRDLVDYVISRNK